MSNEEKKTLVIGMLLEYCKSNNILGFSVKSMADYIHGNYTEILICGSKPTDFHYQNIILWNSVTNCYKTFNTVVSDINAKRKQALKNAFSDNCNKDNKREVQNSKRKIKDVIFNPPATIVFWSDGTKTVVKAHDDDEYDPEKGLAMAFSKKFLGNNYAYYNEFKHWLKRYNKQMEEINDINDIKNFLEIIRAIGRANPLDVNTKDSDS